ncbi:DUF4815 domain-containing protein [Leeia sp. TBRC 13508]|uniref:DUF4815 domain-containing protein n=1 Tax=Leeia speluncae TaxID=2884804 RepID=A0ABS8D830_9NEIS|nr:DUF4815 domain-containing protein [Leeia speluncae]MCB6184292.1 DUF4815 domain-containing protein [Leeia speluncae]
MEKHYIGKGKVLASTVGARGFREFGNCSSLKFSFSEDKKTVADSTSTGGGNAASVTRIKDVTVEMDLRELSAENLALAIFGESSIYAAGNVASEVVLVVGLDCLHPLAHIGASTVVVTPSAGGAAYVAGTDYVVTGAGIKPLTGGAIASGDSLTVSYSYPKQAVIQALAASGKEISLLFDGMNEAASGSPVVVEVYRIKLSPTDSIDFIGDDFATLKLKGEVLKDTTIVQPGLSQFFKASQLV